MNEFQLIKTYFYRYVSAESAADIIIDKGDDCALLAPVKHALAITTDTLVEGVHFLPTISPHALGHRVLATNLSDLAAMGAMPKWFNLAITLPALNENWLAEFSEGMWQLATQHNIALIGGDTTKGPLSITISAMGDVEPSKALKRNAAQLDDDIYVSGTIGDAAAGLQVLLAEQVKYTDSEQYLITRFDYPTPRVELGLALLNVAHAALDISDGLLADLGHICQESGLNAQIHIESLPLSVALRTSVDPQKAVQYALSGGDDYELCFTAPQSKRADIQKIAQNLGLTLSRIGSFTATNEQSPTIECLHEGQPYLAKADGFKHF
ncbi:thiamine-phosphate kinase [Algibacillus agarilyticus]|uniref:thiamine-phosphate kinase n=1 Tax=Algibacillus agarilyticus TaxID=2234133 RepID=UPI000DD050EF|nr:thiamine-phosphate kinase [Algibacillus agarilyticus]